VLIINDYAIFCILLLGAHESTAKGLCAVFDRHRSEAIQIWTSNGSRWLPTRRDPGEVAEFATEARRRRIPLFAHASYLINLACPVERTRPALVDELERSEALGVGGVILHPGNHCGRRGGVRRIVTGIRQALRKTRGYRVKVVLELTAGQGTCIGSTFEELAGLLDAIGEPARTGVCFDTQHAFAAGYDLLTRYDEVWREFDRVIGLDRLVAFHLNDSKRPLGSRVDRHAEIGRGAIGAEPFRRLVRDRRFRQVPAMIELPPEELERSLRRLRRWR
jgi:deoxyribonuclease IV